MLLLPLAIATPDRPSLAAIIDPKSGRAWDRAGKTIPCPLPLGERRSILSLAMAEPEEGYVHRLFVLKSEGGDYSGPSPWIAVTRDDSSADLGQSEAKFYGISMPSVSHSYRLFAAKFEANRRVLNMDLSWEVGPWKDVVAFKVQGKKIVPTAGDDRHPRFVVVPKGYRLLGRTNIAPVAEGYSHDGPCIAVSYDDTHKLPMGVVQASMLYDQRGRAVQYTGNGGIGGRYKIDLFQVPRDEVARFALRIRQTTMMKLPNVVISPSGG